MASNTSNHALDKPEPYVDDTWAELLNNNIDFYDGKLTIVDTEANRSNYSPSDGQEYIATDTGARYRYDGGSSSWVKESPEFNGATFTGAVTVSGGSLTVSGGNVDVSSNAVANPDQVLGQAIKSSPPSSPSAGDWYIDDGTNTASANLAIRVYDGTAWVDQN